MITSWIEKTFSSDKLSDKEMMKALSEMSATAEAQEASESSSFLYELAKVNSEAAFILWQMQKETRLLSWAKKHHVALDSNTQIVTTQLFPVLSDKSTLVLKEGKAYTQPQLKSVAKAMAFRKLEWSEVTNVNKVLFSYQQNELEALLKQDTLSIAAIIAGAKFHSYRLAVAYANKRFQGGRMIRDWTSIQNLLSELFLSVKVDESLVKDLSQHTALAILNNADAFVSQNMQVFGGAGYMEDYIVEKLYRECIFLKNWPMAFREQLITHYQTKAL